MLRGSFPIQIVVRLAILLIELIILKGFLDMTTASPTPFALDHSRRTFSRNHARVQPTRPHFKRGSPLSSASLTNGDPLPQAWKFSIGDSSDDEVPVPPMKFSAEAKAILGDDASAIGGSSPSQKNARRGEGDFQLEDKLWTRQNPPMPKPTLKDRTAINSKPTSGSPRIVRLSPAPIGSATLKRSASVLNNKAPPQVQDLPDLITPAPRIRHMSIYQSDSKHEEVLSADNVPMAANSGSMKPSDPLTAPREQRSAVNDAAQHLESLSINRSRTEETGAQGSLRVKRVGKVTGRYLSGPARRGMKRRQSEEDQSPIQEDAASSGGILQPAVKHEEDLIGLNIESLSPKRKHDPQAAIGSALIAEISQSHQAHVSLITGSPEHINDKHKKIEPLQVSQPKKENGPASVSSVLSGKPMQPSFKVPPLPLLPSRFDQENEPPPTFRRNKPSGLALSENQQKYGVMSEKMLIETPATISPPRQALAPRSQNTPHRPAPPPPKMTVLETATATAGAASASQSRKKRNYISVNQKIFTRMDCIGRGGSSKVYRVMAENYKVFALKRVMLEDQDELAIRGFKGEIDLLQKLENVDRVVRLFDWELNEAKQTLSVLMEMGESDMNRVLTLRLNAEDATFDITFTRYFWKEMLECVAAVHSHDIVHSDLKPANFLLLQGRLKLIDFGISNAIQDDTVNVHREQHIGTPNYMSPEALIDSNATSGLPATNGKMMKLGKPSDIWSLGCILYQMVYGKPPFAHIANQMQRIMAIPNPRHAIEFPPSGIGGVLLPSGLIRTLRRCLNRDQLLRPTVEDLLSPTDPFLNPDAHSQATVPMGEFYIRQIQDSIVGRIRDMGMPSEADLAVWPAKILGSIRASVEAGRGP